MCSLQIGQNDKAKEKKTQSNKVGSSTSTINKQLLSYIEWCLLGVRGNPTMKSFTTLSHFHSTISKGWSISTSFWSSILAYWQTKQVATYSATCFILGHKYILLTLETSLSHLDAYSICSYGPLQELYSWSVVRTQTLYLNLITQSTPSWNSVVWCRSILSFVQDTDQPSAYLKFPYQLVGDGDHTHLESPWSQFQRQAQILELFYQFKTISLTIIAKAWSTYLPKAFANHICVPQMILYSRS